MHTFTEGKCCRHRRLVNNYVVLHYMYFFKFQQQFKCILCLSQDVRYLEPYVQACIAREKKELEWETVAH